MIRKFYEKVFFGMVSPIVKRARHEIISEKDLLPLPTELDPAHSTTIQKLKFDGKHYQFLLRLFRIYGRRISCSYFFMFIALLSSLTSPNLIHVFLARLANGAEIQGNFLVGLALASCGVIAGLAFQYYFYFNLGTYQIITNDINRNIFRQSLNLSMSARSKAQVGDIVNHMSSDTDSVADFPLVIGDFIWALITISTVSILLFFYIGYSALAALFVMGLLIPLTRVVAKRFIAYEEDMLHFRDRRVTLMSQILSAMRVVKYFAWERAVEKEVGEIRSLELSSRQKLARAEVLSGISYLAVGTVVLFVALYVHVLRGKTLDAALIFTCISLFALLEEPFGSLSRLFSRLSQAMVSARRIQEFLQTEQVPHIHTQKLAEKFNSCEITDGIFYYDLQDQPTLTHIQLQIKKSESVAIVGPVGAGKTSLLHALLGEVKQSAGTLRVSEEFDQLAYVPQESYIINSTLLENVTFGTVSASKEFLRKCIHASCLDKDIKELPSGLRTEIGEKGVNLSGGQKQRVSLARAALVDPRIILLDDPLSAVDVETEKILCDRLLFGLWKDKTRVVVTHRLNSLGLFDRVIFIQNGEILADGRLEDLLNNSREFATFYSQHQKVSHENDLTQTQAESGEIPEAEMTGSRITEDEEREKGAVKSQVYLDYILSLGGHGKHRNFIIAALGLGSLCATAFPLLQKWWLSYFSNHKDSLNPHTAILVYGALGLTVLLMSMLNQLVWLRRGIQAGKDMHDNMLKSILNSQIRFFDATPVGRILQRFSRDIESVDVYLQWSFEAFYRCILQVFLSIGLILFVLPLLFIVILPVLWLYYRLQNDYRRPAREAKRLDSIARSPRYAHFKETLQGLVVIRAFHRKDWFFEEFYKRLFQSQKMFYSHYMINRWFSSRIPLLGGVISLATLTGVSLAAKAGALSPGIAGLVTIYSLSFWATLNWGIRIFADIESRMTSVERLKFYSRLPAEIGANFPVSEEIHPAWPENGSVEFKDVRVRYAEHLPLVLKGISFKINSGEKVGVVGRTGSGKSTLFQTLYRFIQSETGKILVSGVDVNQIPLEKYRRVLSIVPQDPTLFVGTLRKNLDRYNEYSDQQINEALKKAGLFEFVHTGLNGGLEASIAENGSNLSQGQRQLLCLARALLVQSKIILMDEATASVDVQTDALIQKVIRESLRGITMIIIAHRLETVSDCDQVIEMADGEIKEIVRRSGKILDIKIDQGDLV